MGLLILLASAWIGGTEKCDNMSVCKRINNNIGAEPEC
jgi:hypothetical protein